MERTRRLNLVSARVTNFCCFEDSGEVPIDDLTVLLAENENGKTSFLRALAWFSSEARFDEDDRWSGADPDSVLDVVALTFDLSKEGVTALKGAGIKAPKRVRVIVNTESEYRVEDADGGDALAPMSPNAPFEQARKALVHRLNELALEQTENDALHQLKNAAPADANASVQAVREEIIPILPPVTHEEVLNLLQGFVAAATEPNGQIDAHSLLDGFLPALIYFDDQVNVIEDQISYEEVAADAEQHRTMVNLAQVGGIPLTEIAGRSSSQRKKVTMKAEKTLTEEASRYWQGEPVTFHLQLDESQMAVVLDHKGRLQPPSRRSGGLKWQLGFYVNFAAETNGELAGAVLLLDEPGLHLHIKQQPKLLELFEDLTRGGNQIIYTTHLSHMLQPHKPHRFRLLVADPTTPGAATVVSNINAIGSKNDVMKPVREALGISIADAVGLGSRTVIGEGLAERYVLLAMSTACQRADGAALADNVTVLPAGGSGRKMVPLVALAASEKTRAVVLVDDDKAGRDTEKLLGKVLPGAIAIVRTHDEAEQTGRELEDLFDRSYYVTLVNDAHRDVEGFAPLKTSGLDKTKPVCDAVEEAFKDQGLGRFQKLKVALELQGKVELGETPGQRSLEAFSALFSRLNSALKGA